MKMRHVISLTSLMIVAGALGLAAQRGGQQGPPQRGGGPAQAPLPPAPPMTVRPVTGQDLLAGLKDPTRWLTFSGEYNGQRHSPLTQLTPQNVAGVSAQWMFQTDIP